MCFLFEVLSFLPLSSLLMWFTRICPSLCSAVFSCPGVEIVLVCRPGWFLVSVWPQVCLGFFFKVNSMTTHFLDRDFFFSFCSWNPVFFPRPLPGTSSICTFVTLWRASGVILPTVTLLLLSSIFCILADWSCSRHTWSALPPKKWSNLATAFK